MTCAEARPLLGAHLDHELDARASLELQAHLAGCAACRAELDALRALGDAARTHLVRHAPPPGLEARLGTAVGAAPRRRRAWIATAGTVLALAAALALFLVVRPRGGPGDRLADELIDAHARSLLADHLTDVPSSDRHTVKPWFNGKVPYGVPVADFAAAGFPLAGGRLDYVGGREVAALVYRRRQHVINAFVWPQAGAAARGEGSARGYTVLGFTRGGLAYWLVSDVSPADLRELQGLFAAAGD